MIEVEQQGAHCRISLSGEIGIYNIKELKQGLIKTLAECEHLEIDLSQVSELDTAGLQVLLCARKDAGTRSKQIQLTKPSDAVRQLLNLYNVNELFGFVSQTQTA